MMDYYSNFPGPTKVQAKNDIIKEIKATMNINSSILLENIIEKELDKEIIEHGGLGSYTGWNVIVKKNIIKKSKDKYIKNIQKTKKKFKLYSKIIGRLQIKLNKSIENIYLPGGKFETETANSNRWRLTRHKINNEAAEDFPIPCSGLCSPYGHTGPCKIIKKRSISPKTYTDYDSDDDYDYEYEFCNNEKTPYTCVLCWKYECPKCGKRSNNLKCPHC